jgi:NRAMP (natural resistance-associated macrophage protein)-like metal ion transporter
MSAVDDDPEQHSAAIGASKPRLFRILGPGLITGASDDDPSGIATYSQAGAQFAYGLSWALLFSFPLMTAIQMISARIGRTTGQGIAGVLRQHYPGWLLHSVVLLLLIANVINLGADLGAMADAMTLLLPGPTWLYLLLFGGLCVGLQVFLHYSSYVRYLKWLSVALVSYVISAFVLHVDWATLGKNLVIPHLAWNQDYLTTTVAIFGTTISPYLFFWQASEEVEDIQVNPRRVELIRAPSQGKAALARIELDTTIGMAFSNIVSLSILVTTAATLFAHGVTDVDTSAKAAAALGPIAGAGAATVFTVGIIGTGLLAVPVLAGSAAYAIGEARRWPTGLARQPHEARAFYATLVVATLVGMGINFAPINPIRALYWSAVINGVVAVPVMTVMMLLVRRADIMHGFAVKGLLHWLGWAATIVMALVVIAMFATMG